MITQKRLKELLDYNENTGIFTWKVSRGNATAGSIAGAFDNSNGYIQLMVDKKNYYAHRLAWLYVRGEFPDKNNDIDHINRIRTDNRIVNLREVSISINLINSPTRKDNTSGIRGVCWDKRNKTWLARISFNNKEIYLGNFKNKLDATKARWAAEKKYGFNKYSVESSALNYIKEYRCEKCND